MAASTGRRMQAGGQKWGGVAGRTRTVGRREPDSPALLRLNPKQDDFVFSEARFAFYVGGVGAGKALALDTPIPTPSG